MTHQPLQKVSSTSWDWSEMRDFCFSQAMRVVGNPETADDAAQEAVMRAWRHRDRCRQPGEPFGWLRRIARNEAVRAAGRRPNEVLVDEPPADPNGPKNESELVEDRLLFS